MAQMVKNLPAVQETQVRSLGHEDPLEKGMATHSSILAWRTPWGRKELDMTECLILSLFPNLIKQLRMNLIHGRVELVLNYKNTFFSNLETFQN